MVTDTETDERYAAGYKDAIESGKAKARLEKTYSIEWEGKTYRGLREESAWNGFSKLVSEDGMWFIVIGLHYSASAFAAQIGIEDAIDIRIAQAKPFKG